MTSEQMVNLYSSGLNASEIARSASCTKQTILYHLRKHDVKIRDSNTVVKRLTNTDEKQVIDEYLAGASQRQLGLRHSVNISVITNTLIKNNIGVRGVRESVGYKDVSIPKPIDGDIFYYWLGWMLSDGWIYQRKNNMRNIALGLGSVDREIIEFFRDTLSHGRKIYECQPRGFLRGRPRVAKKFYRLLLPIDENTKQSLALWGLVPRKSLILKPTENLINLDDTNFCQLLVGLIEGDGTIYRHRKSGKLVIVYYGTEAMCLYVASKIGFGYVARNREIYATIWNHRNAMKLAKQLSTVKLALLKRKWSMVMPGLAEDLQQSAQTPGLQNTLLPS